MIAGFSAIGKAFGVLKTALLGNPWMLVAAAAIAAIVLIVKNWDKIKEFFAKLWEKVKEIFSVAWEGIKTALLAVWNGIKAGAQAIFEGIKAYFMFILNIYKTIFKTAFNIIKNYIVAPIKNAVESVKKFFENLRSNVVGKISALRDSVKNIFGKIKNVMVAPIEKARDLIKKIIDKIKSFFNFDFRLPKIKLPHFSIQPPGWSLGDLLEGSIPSLGIDWYAKGGIFRSPSVIGVGEKGPEAALPLDPFWKKMDRIVEAVESGGGDDITINVYAPEGADVKQIAAEVERRLARVQKKKESVWT